MKELRGFAIAFLGVLGLCTPVKGQVFINYDSAIVIEEGGNWYTSPEIARLQVDLDEFPFSQLAFSLPGDASLFVDEVMWLFTASDTSFIVPVQEVKEKFRGQGALRELIIYKKGIQPGEISVKKGIFDKGTVSPSALTAMDTPLHRARSTIEPFFFLAVLGVFCLIALFKVIYPSVLSFVVHPVLLFSTEDFSESNSITKFFTEEVLFFLVIFNMLIMLLIMVGFYYLGVPVLNELASGDLNHLFLIWLFGTGILLLFSLLKFVWLKISALVFGIHKMEFVHFFYMLRVTSVILIGVYFGLILSFTNELMPIPVLIQYLLIGFFIVYILGVIMLFFMMAAKVSLKNYHLFSYLCTAELVPFLVLSKLIIG